MNAYEELDDNDWRAKEEVRDLALMAILLRPGDGISAAWETLNKAAEFLAEKKKIREAEGKAYWESPEGKARKAEVEAMFNRKRQHLR